MKFTSIWMQQHPEKGMPLSQDAQPRAPKAARTISGARVASTAQSGWHSRRTTGTHPPQICESYLYSTRKHAVMESITMSRTCDGREREDDTYQLLEMKAAREGLALVSCLRDGGCPTRMSHIHQFAKHASEHAAFRACCAPFIQPPRRVCQSTHTFLEDKRTGSRVVTTWRRCATSLACSTKTLASQPPLLVQ